MEECLCGWMNSRRSGRSGHCGLIAKMLSGKRKNFSGWRQSAEGLGNQEIALVQRWDRKTKRGLFGDQKLQLTLLSTSCMAGTMSGVEVTGPWRSLQSAMGDELYL